MADSIVDESAKLSASILFQDPTLPFESCHYDPWTGPGSNVIARNTTGPVYLAQAISRIVNGLGLCTFLEAGVGGPSSPWCGTRCRKPKLGPAHLSWPSMAKTRCGPS
ncbi:hypothetical protein HRG_013798 [Hirsutella rhossiliensis]